MRRLGASAAAALVAVAALAVPMVNAADDPGDTGQDKERGGPPPWAHSVGAGKKDKSGLDAWKQLGPAQREVLMARLTREHSDGMKAYGACRDDGRADCEKPLPPGLAKRQ
jgi:hypothetical protein